MSNHNLASIQKEMRKEQRKTNIRRLIHNRFVVIGFIIVFALVFIAIFAPVISPYDPYELDVVNRLSGPSAKHLLGTDTFGRDLLSRIIYGARISTLVGASVAILTLIIGLIIGLYSGYYKKVDRICMRICDGLKAIPSILLAIALVAVMGAGTTNIIISLTIVYFPNIARITRSVTLKVKEQTYIEALKASGSTDTRIIVKNILPNVISPVLVQVSFIFANAVITEASLSFLGVGIPVPEPSWGNIINEGKTVIFTSWWMIVFPAIATALSVFGLNLLGDGLRDYLDPLTN